MFVARERELAQLNGFLGTALAGHGTVCFVTGEAGSGKTALVTEFARRAQDAHTDLLVAIGDCNAQTGIGDPYLPFREVLGQLTGDVEAKLAQGAITQENAGRLQDFLRVSGQTLVEYGPDLIDIFVPGGALATRVGTRLARRTGWLDRLEELTEQKAAAGPSGLQQSRLFEQFTAVLQALAAQNPLILVVDDLQWVDVSSVSLLFHLGRRIGESPILIVGAYRPADVALGRPSTSHRGELAEPSGQAQRHPLEGVVNEFRRYFGDIRVHLSQAAVIEGQQFVDAWLDTEPNRLGEGFRQALFKHTRGHPLFTIELLRAMQERGDLARDDEGRWVEGPTLAWDALPARVEGAIEERISRLEAELREILTVASVEGEDFTAQVIARVQEVRERRLLRDLSRELEKRHRLVRERGEVVVGGQLLSRYRFAHALFQQYLYNDLGAGERRLLHGEIAEVLEALYVDQTGEVAVQLAQHFQEAGIAEKAVDYLLQAGNRAIRLSANEEAVAHLTRGLDLLKTLPESPERIQQELTLQTILGVPLVATKGYAAPEVEQAYTRARELCQQVGETPQLSQVLQGLYAFYLLRAEYKTARELGEQLLTLAQSVDDLALLLEAHRSLGAALFHTGEPAPARVHLEQAIALFDPQQHSSHAFLYGTDPWVVSLSHAALALWLLGYPDQALERIHESLTWAQELSHAFSLAYALDFAATLHHFRREVQATQAQAEAAIALCTDQGIPFWLAMGTVLRGWALAEQGQPEEGIAQTRQGLAAFQATGAELGRSWFLVMLAEAYGEGGQVEEGLSVLAEAQAFVDHSGEHWWEAELRRLKGELLAQDKAEVEACFRQAIEVAHRQQAKSLELRATMSLCRLLQSQGKREEGRQMLAEIYGWFTEGFDTQDLKEAKALLEELSQ